MTDPVTALVLAGDRGPKDALIQATGLPCKALLDLGGRAMALRVLDALGGAATVGRIALCGPRRAALPEGEELTDAVIAGRVGHIEPAGSPCASVVKALEELGDADPVLVTTGDHALLSPMVVDTFVHAALATDGDMAFGVTALRAVADAYPQLEKTGYRLRGEAWCGCNLFLFRSGRAKTAADYWRRVEANRKTPWRAARLIGWGFLLSYLLRRLTLAEAADHIGGRMGLVVRPVELPFPEAAVDVDSVADWEAVQDLV